GIIGIEPSRLIEVIDRLAIAVEITTLKIEMPLEVRIVRFYTLRCSDLSIFRSKQGHLQGLSHRGSDLSLNGEDILEFTIERSRPQFNPIRGIHQFGDDAHAVPLFPHCAFQKRAHTQLLANGFAVLFSLFKAERRAAADHLELSNLRQTCD